MLNFKYYNAPGLIESSVKSMMSEGYTPVIGGYFYSSGYNIVFSNGETGTQRLPPEYIEDISLLYTTSQSQQSSLNDKLSNGWRVYDIYTYGSSCYILAYKPSQLMIDLESESNKKKSGWALVKYEEVDAPE